MINSIAVVVPEMLPVPAIKGGAVEHWVEEFCNRIRKPELKLAVVSRPADVPGSDGIEYIEVPWTNIDRFFYQLKEKKNWHNPLHFLAKIQNVSSYAIKVSRLVRNFDLIYIHNDPNLILFVKKRNNQKVILHMHNDHLSSPIFKPIYKLALSKVDSVICVSDYIRQKAINSFPEYKNKFITILNSTNPDIFKPYGNIAKQMMNGIVDFNPNYRYILYVGRLKEIKGIHILIEAFCNVHAQIPNTRMVITGTSFFKDAAKTAYEQKLIKLAEKASDAIFFTGFLPHDKLCLLYSAADIVVCPSIWEEPFGLVIIEAMSSGTCVVASKVGGIPEVIINDIDGILVTPNNPEALAIAISNLLEYPEKKLKMELRGREKVLRDFTWIRLINEFETLLKTLS